MNNRQNNYTEKRKHPRLNRLIPLKMFVENPQTKSELHYEATAKNISKEGMFIEPAQVDGQALLNLVHPQKRLTLEINSLPSNRQIRVVAEVKWANENGIPPRRSGLGVEFVRFGGEQERIIDSYITEGLREEGLREIEHLPPIRKADLVPRQKGKNYSAEFVDYRRGWLIAQTKRAFRHLFYHSIKPEEVRGNIENFVGVAQVPIGIAGPLKVNGEYAKGNFYVPFATTEGALVETYHRGMLALTVSGGVNTVIHKDENNISPVFLLKDISQARDFVSWIKDNFMRIKQEAERTTEYGKLLKITPYPIGRRVILNFTYFTADAMGANMINVATEEACRFIVRQTKVEKYLLRSNLSSEKKVSFFSFLMGYGKEISVEALLPRKVIRKYLGSTPEEIYNAWYSWALGSFQAGTIGINAHYANALTAIFLACGQDVAHVVNASAGISMCEVTEAGDLYTALRLPNILVGTVGGGTALGTQRECLDMMRCYGPGKAKKFAEIVAASLLAGEIALSAGLASGKFMDAHRRAREATKRKEFQSQKDQAE